MEKKFQVLLDQPLPYSNTKFKRHAPDSLNYNTVICNKVTEMRDNVCPAI